MNTVLIVDDERLAREGIGGLVDWTAMAFRIVGMAEDGQIAQDMILQHRPDVVITDIKMPFVDGLELIEWIRSEAPQTIPVILSGYDEFDLAQKAIQLGAFAYLLKPVEPVELAETLIRVRERVRENERRQVEMRRLRTLGGHAQDSLVLATVSRLLRGVTVSDDQMHQLEARGLVGGRTQVLVGLCATEQQSIGRRLWHHIEQEQDRANRIVIPETDYRFVLIAWAPTREEARVLGRQLIEDLNRYLGGRGEGLLTVGLSRPTASIDRLPIAYEEAERMLGLAMLTVPGSTREPSQPIAELERFDDVAYLDLSRAAVRAVSDRDVSALAKVCSEIAACASAHAAVPMLIPVLLGYILFTVRTTVEREQLILPADWLIERLKLLGRHDSAAMKVSSVRSSLTEIIEALLKIDRPPNERRVAHAIQIVEERFAETGLSVDVVASEVGMSANYFSSVFRGRVGMGFVEYLTTKRVERAKELLQRTTLRSYEIAEQVGYQHPSYFATVFRTVTGMTPSQFRENLTNIQE